MLQVTQKFSILFSARTGSSYLQTALDNHPHISCTNENEITSIVCGGGVIKPDYCFHLDNLDIGTKYNGIKVPIGPFLAVMEKYPFSHGFWKTNIWGRPIIICTRNPLYSFISYKLVKENNAAWFKKQYTKPVKINIEEAQKFVCDITRILNPFLNMKNERIIILRYEDGMDMCYKKALDFLDVDYQPPVSVFTKQATKPLRELVLNYNELEGSCLGDLLRCTVSSD